MLKPFNVEASQSGKNQTQTDAVFKYLKKKQKRETADKKNTTVGQLWSTLYKWHNNGQYKAISVGEDNAQRYL